jgi:integrase/recombinase XerC
MGQSGIESTPHSFRHHFASRLLSAGASVADVQKLQGHSSVAITTKVYLHANTDALAEVYARFSGGGPGLGLVGP